MHRLKLTGDKCCGLQIGIVYGNPEVTTGGNALKYYCSVRVDVRRKEYIHLGGKKEAEAVGIRVKAKVPPLPPFQTTNTQPDYLLI